MKRLKRQGVPQNLRRKFKTMQERLLSDLGSILSGVASKSADYADVYMQSGASHALLFEEGRMDTLSSARSDGLGVRVVCQLSVINTSIILA